MKRIHRPRLARRAGIGRGVFSGRSRGRAASKKSPQFQLDVAAGSFLSVSFILSISQRRLTHMMATWRNTSWTFSRIEAPRWSGICRTARTRLAGSRNDHESLALPFRHRHLAEPQARRRSRAATTRHGRTGTCPLCPSFTGFRYVAASSPSRLLPSRLLPLSVGVKQRMPCRR